MTKNPLLIAVVGVVLAGFGFYHFALQPKQKEASAAKAKVASAQSELESARALLTTNQRAQKTYRSDYATVVRLGKAVPADDDVRSLVVQLDNAAKATRLDFEDIEVDSTGGATPGAAATTTSTATTLPPGATVGPAGFPVMPFSFTFRGGFFRLAAFFAKLNGFVTARNDKLGVTGRLLTIDAVKLEPDDTGFPNVKATVKATSYLVSPVEGATGGATVATPGGAGSTSASGGTAPGSTTAPTTTATLTGAIR